MLKNNIEAILFDLDGTLLDTAHDLVSALHLLMNKPNPFDTQNNKVHRELRAAAGRGCKGLIKAGLNIEDTDERYSKLAEELLQHYDNHLLDTTQLFPGMSEVLKHLEQNNIPWGIVTNKPDKYTKKILGGLQLTVTPQCVISGDSLKNRKPHPEPLLHACQLLQKAPQQCLYVGDTEVDVIASKAAGMPSLVALYGYTFSHEDPLSWKADGYIEHPKEILSWVKS